jgi:pyridinium-3,5-bisthiocarboxylic acid mononucleotide nickel chelatase
MRIAHVEPFSGVSGDMLLGAVVDAGVALDDLERVLRGLDLDGWSLHAEPVKRQGLGATLIRVDGRDDGIVRTWGNVRSILAAADLPEPVRARAVGAFSRLAEAEARVHRIAVDRVHFHEVGALDSIIDVVGVCAGLHLLGVESLSSGPVAMGTGMVRTGHGFIPIPAPAVVELLRGAPTMATDISAELCTPTGAALLAEWVTTWGPQAEMVVDLIGYGAGTRELDRPNVVRVSVGEMVRTTSSGQALILQTTIDDLPGELLPPVLGSLRTAGAGDAWATPVLMKKGRPGQEITCIADPWHGDALRAVLFRETTTLGVRGHLVDKWQLQREWVTVEVAGCAVRLKVGRLRGEVVNVAPEYEDCAAAAAATGLALKEVFARARAAWSVESPPTPAPPDAAS